MSCCYCFCDEVEAYTTYDVNVVRTGELGIDGRRGGCTTALSFCALY